MIRKIIIIILLLVAGGTAWYFLANRDFDSAPENAFQPEDAAQAMRRILAEKYNKPLSEVNIKITGQTEAHIAGSVSFTAPGRLPEPGESGMFLAMKKTGEWQVVYDGNGSVDCGLLTNTYNFPADVLAGFCD
ncbi:MAG: hypothetical protein COU85_01420 [Candidatus Portnoybacteria bacterium CG10_big_fil_rev_8_21_14_0_10_44_7]|uniref:Uncharacterized protein n=1 Tax=Candidatus Portnoybacteria bacterium CG10_big_fil_rev_8_21_14_0_10_44_7 TaxID=1974816 RepID=A0A2M8KIV3_9BACT|nr:MAG: hypothetical protein COU85_01420 [Candidatus Portnoybacteria bacterium CG10_big_fil_rev_8_21_14_0_10_44_7]